MSTISENDILLESAKPNASVIVVTPDMASRWLERNAINRRIKPAAISRFARDMKAGRWELTGEAIKFGADGYLKDGQNRLHACVKSGTPFVTFVIRGVSATAQRVMDTGSARTAADALSIAGEKHTALLAAAARIAIEVEAGVLDQRNYQPTHAEIEAFLHDNPDMRDAAAFASRVARRTDCPPSMVTYTTWALGRINPKQAYDFWLAAAEKADLRPGDPVIALTNRFAEARRSHERLPRRAYLSAIYRAWNARRKGQPLRQLKLNSSAGGLVPVPEPK